VENEDCNTVPMGRNLLSGSTGGSTALRQLPASSVTKRLNARDI